jgi:hypothetical protein
LSSLYFPLALFLIGCGAAFWIWQGGSTLWPRFFVGGDIIATPLVGPIAIILALLIGFGGADMRDRSRELRHVAQQEADEARSILKFTEGVGALAQPLRQAMIEYLQVATTTERDWIESGSAETPPGQSMADSLVLFATLFALQGSNSDSVKNVLVSDVDRLRQARVSRLNLSRQATSLPEWILITVLALITQAMIALTQVGKPRATFVCLAAFSFAIFSVYFYLAWIDGLIGASKVMLSIIPLKEVLDSIVY